LTRKVLFGPLPAASERQKDLRAASPAGFSLKRKPSAKPASILDEVPESVIPAQSILIEP